MEYDYDAVNPDELTIKVGDTITGIKIMEGGWWEGEVNGKRGMFPDNFVKVNPSLNYWQMLDLPLSLFDNPHVSLSDIGIGKLQWPKMSHEYCLPVFN